MIAKSGAIKFGAEHCEAISKSHLLPLLCIGRHNQEAEGPFSASNLLTALTDGQWMAT